MSTQEVQSKINLLLGKNAWGVSIGHGSFLTLEFGQPVPINEQPPMIQGEWHLWIYCCVWRLEEGDKILAASEDDRDKLKLAVQRLENLALQSIDLISSSWDLVLTFEHQVVLRTFAIYSEEYQNWMLFTPDSNVLTAGPGSSWIYESRSEPRQSV